MLCTEECPIVHINDRGPENADANGCRWRKRDWQQKLADGSPTAAVVRHARCCVRQLLLLARLVCATGGHACCDARRIYAAADSDGFSADGLFCTAQLERDARRVEADGANAWERVCVLDATRQASLLTGVRQASNATSGLISLTELAATAHRMCCRRALRLRPCGCEGREAGRW